METKKSNSGWKVFLAGFLVMIVLMAVSALRSKKGQALQVPNNKGMARMATLDGLLAAVFQNGQTCVWDWSGLDKPAHQFKVPSDRAVFLSGSRLGAIAKANSTLLSLYDLASGQKQRDIRVGSVADEVWPAVSPNGQTLLIVRRLTAPGNARYDYEFMILNLDDELLGIPTVISVSESDQSIVDFAVTDGGRALVAGIKNGQGRLLALDLDQGSVSWDRTYENTKEFCSVVLSADNAALYAGNRDGKLYKINPESGNVEKEIVLLQEGETRDVTNDVSVLNLSTDSQGQYVAATITPVSYIIDTRTDTLLHRWSSAHRLSSKIAFSPDNRYVATSDIRAGWPVDIWELEKLK